MNKMCLEFNQNQFYINHPILKRIYAVYAISRSIDTIFMCLSDSVSQCIEEVTRNSNKYKYYDTI